MNALRKTTAAMGVAALIAVPAAVMVGSPANADTEHEGRCAGAQYELSIDREAGGFEVDADIDDAARGSKWRITLRHDGKVIYKRVRTADHEGDIDVERFRHNTAGKDAFTLRVKNMRSGKACSTTVTMR